MGNRPVEGVDPDGRLFGTALTAIWDFVDKAFTDGGLDFTASSATRNNAWAAFDPSAPWSKTHRAARIDGGLFQTDDTQSWLGRGLQLLSRFSWESPQTLFGNLVNHSLNVAGTVNDVSYFRGRTAVNSSIFNDFTGGAFAIGNYITGPPNMQASFQDHLFVHEFGHTLQSRLFGPMYLFGVGVPSLLSAGVWPRNHETRWFEADASRRGANYFDREFGTGVNGYVPGREAFFDRNSFVNGGRSLYINRRTGSPNFGDNPTRYRFRWYDPLIQVAWLLPLFVLFP
jgi:hypothetical protein